MPPAGSRPPIPVGSRTAPRTSTSPARTAPSRYDEGVFVGYRHYDTHGIEPRWCFGHGLSYTTFAYSPLSVRRSDAGSDGDDEVHVVVSVDVTNTGRRPGSEVVQVYVRHVGQRRSTRPDRELKGFEKVTLDPGETTSVTVVLDRRAFAFWDTESSTWRLEPGEYRIMAGSSSRAIEQSVTLSLP